MAISAQFLPTKRWSILIYVYFLIYSKVIHIIVIISIIIIIIITIIIEIVFFFYVLYLAASINTLHDKFIDIANKKFWEVKKKIDRKADNKY